MGGVGRSLKHIPGSACPRERLIYFSPLPLLPTHGPWTSGPLCHPEFLLLSIPLESVQNSPTSHPCHLPPGLCGHLLPGLLASTFPHNHHSSPREPAPALPRTPMAPFSLTWEKPPPLSLKGPALLFSHSGTSLWLLPLPGFFPWESTRLPSLTQSGKPQGSPHPNPLSLISPLHSST